VLRYGSGSREGSGVGGLEIRGQRFVASPKRFVASFILFSLRLSLQNALQVSLRVSLQSQAAGGKPAATNVNFVARFIASCVATHSPPPCNESTLMQ